MPSSLRTILLASMLAVVQAAALSTSSSAEPLEVIRIEIDFFAEGSSEPVNHATVWTSDRRLRVEQSAPGQVAKRATFIYRGDEDLLFSVSERDRSYAQVRRQVISAFAQETKQPRRELDAQLRALPSDQRKAFERLLGVSRQHPDTAHKPVRVRREGGRATVAGFDCFRVVLSREERPFGEACVASWEQLGMTPSDVEIFRSLANFERDAMGARALTPMELVPDQPLDLIVQFGGLPLSFERKVAGRQRSAIRVTSVNRIEAPASLFEPPAGYARRDGYRAFLAQLQPPPSAPAASPAAPAPAAARPSTSRPERRKPQQAKPVNADTSWKLRDRRRTYRVLLLPER
jgi:hypothetical protein